MRVETVMACVLGIGIGFAGYGLVQPKLADERELAVVDREIACRDTEEAVAVMARRPFEPDTDVRCVLLHRLKPAAPWERWLLPKKVAA